MKTNITKKSVTQLIESKKKTVEAYTTAKELPKYIANELISQLNEAIGYTESGDYDMAYCSLIAFNTIKENHASGCYSKSPRVNRYYHFELSTSQEFSFLLALGLKILGGKYKHDVNVRLLDCNRKFEVNKYLLLKPTHEVLATA